MRHRRLLAYSAITCCNKEINDEEVYFDKFSWRFDRYYVPLRHKK